MLDQAHRARINVQVGIQLEDRTLYHDFSSRPRLAIIPLPMLETTPPVMKTNLAMTCLAIPQGNFRSPWSPEFPGVDPFNPSAACVAKAVVLRMCR